MEPDAALTPSRQRWLIVAVFGGLLLAMLDQTIVGTALPRIVAELGGQHLYIWLVTAYLVPATVSLPVYARLSDRYGRRALLLTGMVLFLAGSALSATAQDMTQLIVWRGLQGLGAGALEGLSFILVADLFAGRRSAALQGALAGLMGVSFLAGPMIGGFLTDQVGWRAVFVVNLPIGVAAFAVVAAVLPAAIGRREGRETPLDLAGIALLTGAVGLLLVGLNLRAHPDGAGHLPGWLALDTGGLIAAALALLVAFVAVERRAAAPVMPLGLLTDRRTGAIMVAAATGAFGLFAGVLLLPLYFQNARDVSATHSGLLIYPLLIGLLVSVNVGAAVIVRRLDFRTPILAGAVLAAAGALGFATFDATTPDWQSLVFMGLIGLGVGPTLSGLQIAIQRTVTPASIGAAMGTLMLLRQVGASVALTAAATLYAGGLHDVPGQARAATATGHAVLFVTLAGSVVAVVALLSLGRGGGRLAAVAVAGAGGAPPGPPAAVERPRAPAAMTGGS
jgi:EmrB/QacA subfamily drug resistance transporter